MRKMCTLITSKGTDIDENIANQNHATRTRTPKPGYLNLSIYPLHRTKIWKSVSENKCCLSRENQKESLHDFLSNVKPPTWTMVVIFFEFSLWIINEIFKHILNHPPRFLYGGNKLFQNTKD
jgi:hypothetical protein